MTEIARLLTATSISKAKVASKMGVTPTTVSNWVTGKHRTPAIVLEWLKKVDAVISSKTGFADAGRGYQVGQQQEGRTRMKQFTPQEQARRDLAFVTEWFQEAADVAETLEKLGYDFPFFFIDFMKLLGEQATHKAEYHKYDDWTAGHLVYAMQDYALRLGELYHERTGIGANQTKQII